MILNDNPIKFFPIIINLQNKYEVTQVFNTEDLINKYKKEDYLKVFIDSSSIEESCFLKLKNLFKDRLEEINEG